VSGVGLVRKCVQLRNQAFSQQAICNGGFGDVFQLYFVGEEDEPIHPFDQALVVAGGDEEDDRVFGDVCGGEVDRPSGGGDEDGIAALTGFEAVEVVGGLVVEEAVAIVARDFDSAPGGAIVETDFASGDLIKDGQICGWLSHGARKGDSGYILLGWRRGFVCRLGQWNRLFESR
jgi:hypothetical protein